MGSKCESRSLESARSLSLGVLRRGVAGGGELLGSSECSRMAEAGGQVLRGLGAAGVCLSSCCCPWGSDLPLPPTPTHPPVSFLSSCF